MDKIMGFLLLPTLRPPHQGKSGWRSLSHPSTSHLLHPAHQRPTLSTLCSGEFSHSLLGLGPCSWPHTNPGSKT